MFQVKSCPRCVGDLYLQNLTGVHEWTCLHCGHSLPACVTTSAPPSFAEFRARRFDAATDDDLRRDPLHVERTLAPARPEVGLPLSA